ncbi:MAG: mechanosensitive ion channel domain-containing protein [Pseudomonadota bacterium]
MTRSSRWSDHPRLLLRVLPTTQAFLGTLLTLFCWCASPVAVGAEDAAATALDARIAALQALSPVDGSDEATALALLNRARQRQLAEAAGRKRLGELEAELETASERLAALNDELVDQQALARLPTEPLSPEELEQRIADSRARLARYQTRQSTLEQRLRELLGSDLPQELAKARTNLDALAPVETSESAPLSQAAASTLFDAQAAQARQRVTYLERRLASRNEQQSQARQELEVLTELIDTARRDLDRLLANDLARTLGSAEQERARAVELTARVSRADGPATLRTWIAENQKLADELRSVAIVQRRINVQSDRVEESLERLRTLESNLTAQLERGGLANSPARGASLLRQRAALNAESQTLTNLRPLQQQLAEAELRQFELLDAIQAAWGASTADLVATDDAELQSIATGALAQRRSLLEQLSDGYAANTERLASTSASTMELRTVRQALKRLLDGNLLWTRSAALLSPATLLTAGEQLLALSSPASLAGILSRVPLSLTTLPLIVGILGLAAALQLSRRKHINELKAMGANVGRVQRDRMSLTFRALWLTTLMALPLPLLLALPALVLSLTNEDGNALITTSWSLAALFLVLMFLRQSMRDQGLVLLHFRWSEPLIQRLRYWLRWLLPGFLVAVGLAHALTTGADSELASNLGRLGLIAALVLLLLAGTGFYRRAPDDSAWRYPRWLALLLVAIAGALLLLSALGYHYSADLLGTRLLHTVGALIGVLYLYALTLRAFSIQERRIALDRAREKRAALLTNEPAGLQTETEEGTMNVEIDRIDLQTISSQTRALARLVMVTVAVLAVAAIWADFPVVFEPLQSVPLWHITEDIDGVSVRSPVTLWHLLMAIVVAVVAWISVSNIPGTLEAAVLNRLPLSPGTGYAITSVTSYIIVIAGAVTVLQLLGAQWSKLQWLVAALSVGLGFGLQEIVANFISGLLILFERPVRLGDVVTIGDQTGVVSRIRIRATTITDWDRREILIPNKAFITERLTNWTLTDPITRAIVYVGVAYGSNVELAEQTLREIAIEHPKVLDDPTPSVLFLSFGDNSLGFELRVFVAGLGDSVAVRHDLHKAIDARFRELGIEISFPQRDIHFDPKPLEIVLVDGKPGTGSTTPGPPSRDE